MANCLLRMINEVERKLQVISPYGAKALGLHGSPESPYIRSKSGAPLHPQTRLACH